MWQILRWEEERNGVHEAPHFPRGFPGEATFQLRPEGWMTVRQKKVSGAGTSRVAEWKKNVPVRRNGVQRVWKGNRVNLRPYKKIRRPSNRRHPGSRWLCGPDAQERSRGGKQRLGIASYCCLSIEKIAEHHTGEALQGQPKESELDSTGSDFEQEGLKRKWHMSSWALGSGQQPAEEGLG